jgi:hypothetical protein
MAFTYSIVDVSALAVGDQVRAAVAADGHCYSYPVPTTGGATFATVSKIVVAPAPPGASASEVLYTVYIGASNPYSLPVDFTLKGTSNDFVVKATGTA